MLIKTTSRLSVSEAFRKTYLMQPVAGRRFCCITRSSFIHTIKYFKLSILIGWLVMSRPIFFSEYNGNKKHSQDLISMGVFLFERATLTASMIMMFFLYCRLWLFFGHGFCSDSFQHRFFLFNGLAV